MPLLAVVGTIALLAAAVAPAGTWPVDPPPGADRIVAPYAPPARDWQAGHRGVDLAAAPGAPVRAMAPGVVVFTGRVGAKPVIVVRLADGRRLTYEPVIGRVDVGMSVQAGETIGVLAADGGHCAGRGCVHVGLRTATGYADPTGLVDRRPAVLKPLRSGARVGLGERRPQSFDRHVGVALGRGERGVAE